MQKWVNLPKFRNDTNRRLIVRQQSFLLFIFLNLSLSVLINIYVTVRLKNMYSVTVTTNKK